MPPAFIHTGRLLGRGVPVINRAHPLAQGLLACWVPAMAPGGKVINLASPGSVDLTTRSGVAVGLGSTREGPGVAFTGTAAASLNSGAVPASWHLNTGPSLFVRALKTGTVTANHLASFIGLSGSVSPFYAFLLGLAGTQSGGAGTLNLMYNNGGIAAGGSIIPALGAMFSAGATFGAGVVPSLYVNGVNDPLTANNGTTNLSYSGTIQAYLGQQNAASSVDATITVGYIWRRPLTAVEMRYLDATPSALLLWPSDRVALALATLSGGTAVIANAILAAEFPESLHSDSGVTVESLAGGSAITENATLLLEFSATVLRDWGAGAARSMIRRFSRPALVGRVRRLFFPGHPGMLAIESEGRQHADPGAPIESLGSAGNSVAGDAMSPVETLSSQRSELGSPIENTASPQVDPVAPVESLAASLLDIHGPVEALAGGITTITDANLAIEWVTAAPSILVSLESGPERVRLLATRGRVRLLRRK
jgi:hypothetical protein